MNRGKSKRVRDADRPFSAAMNVEERRPRRPSLRFVLLCAMILLVSGGIVGLSLSLPEKTARPNVQAFGTTVSTPTTLNPAIPNPAPWQYDQVTNQHWDPTPGHVHWHSGLPPANPGAASPGTTNLGAAGVAATLLQSGTPDIPNPQPWQYDPVTNKHWNPLPGHQHWHDGTAPPPDQRQ